MKENKAMLSIVGSVLVILLCLFGRPISVLAMEKVEDEEMRPAEIVFLLDTSESMNRQDRERTAIDAIRQISYALPSNYQVGLVAYNTGIQTIVPLSLDLQMMDTTLDSIRYDGYTNAGEGLTEAVKLFSENDDTDKYIIMISDGEIDMPDKEKREYSRVQYVEAANLAKEKDIKILITAIGMEMNSQMHIFDGAEMTNGAIYWEGQNGSVSQIMEKILSERLKVPMQSVGVTDAGGGNIHAKLSQNADRIKVLVIGNTDINKVTADYSAAEGHIIEGQKFAVVDMKRPDSEYTDIHFQTEDISGVRVYLLTEYQAKLEMNISYRIEELPRTEREIKEHILPNYEHFADITIALLDAAESEQNLWKDGFEGQEVNIWLNNTLHTGIIVQGQVQMSIPADTIEEIEATIEMEPSSAIYYIEQPVIEKIERYPDPVPEPEPDYRPLWVILFLLVSSMSIIFFCWIKKRNTMVIYMASEAKEMEKKLETRNCTYSGRLSMYVVRTKDGRDIPPQTYVLFGKAPGRLTLDKVLTSCGIKFGKIGAEDIIFYPGPEHSIILMDQSERCTVMRGTEIMKKGMGYPVFYNEKITVAFEDEMTEMEIHYKNLKPGERERIKGI